MKNKLYYCEIKTPLEERELAIEILNTLSIEFSSESNVKNSSTIYKFYSESEGAAKAIAKKIEDFLPDWKKLGLNFSETKIKSIYNEDWTEVWKKHFKIQHITENIVIKADWLNYSRKGEEIVININPEMSFGTGSHETTRFCLRMIEWLAYKKDSPISLLDAGCGSGILTIAAQKFGFSSIHAFDNEKESINTAKRNLEKNSCFDNKIKIFKSSVENYSPGKKFDIVVANIISSVLTKNRFNLMNWVLPNGYLVLAGILSSEYEEIKEKFLENQYLNEVFSCENEGWTGGVFKINKNNFDKKQI